VADPFKNEIRGHHGSFGSAGLNVMGPHKIIECCASFEHC